MSEIPMTPEMARAIGAMPAAETTKSAPEAVNTYEGPNKAIDAFGTTQIEAQRPQNLAELRNLGRERIEQQRTERMARLAQTKDRVKEKAGGLVARLQKAWTSVRGGISAAKQGAGDALATGYAVAATPEGRGYVADKIRQGTQAVGEAYMTNVDNKIDQAIDRGVELQGVVQERAREVAGRVQTGVEQAYSNVVSKVEQAKQNTRERATGSLQTADNRIRLAFSQIKNAALRQSLQVLMTGNFAIDGMMKAMQGMQGRSSETIGKLGEAQAAVRNEIANRSRPAAA